MNLAQCEDALDKLEGQYEALMEKLVKERELADTAASHATQAVYYLEQFKGRSNDVAIALGCLRDCSASLNAMFKEAT